jgi:RNA polymerase sigma factor (sigma-70 family)
MKQKKYFLLLLHSKKAEAPGERKPTDAECTGKIIAGNEKFFSVIEQRYKAELLRYANAYLSDYGECKNIVQDVFIEFLLLLRSGKYHEEGRVHNLLVQMTHHRVLDYLRYKHKHEELFTELPEDFEVAEKATWETYKPKPKKMLRLCIAWRQLKELPRKIFMLRYHEGKTFEEIGKLIGMKTHTVKSIQRRTEQKLSKIVALAT